jgi:hypothetical protein
MRKAFLFFLVVINNPFSSRVRNDDHDKNDH